MVTSNILKGNVNILPGAIAHRAVRLLLATVAGAALVFSTTVGARELSFGDPPDSIIEDQIEQSVEEQAEENLQDAIADGIEDRIEERVLTFGDGGFEAFIEQSVEDDIQDSVEDVLEDAIQDDITDNLEITLEGNIEDEIEQDVEETIDAIVEESVEDSVEDRIEEAVAENVAETVEESLETTVEEELASTVEQNLESGVELTVESAVEVQVASNVEERLEDNIDQILERIEIDESRIERDQWLVMAAPEVFDQLAAEGYLFATVTELPGMGLRLAEVAAPSSFDISQVRQGVIDVVGSERAEVDLNHIYTAGHEVVELDGPGMTPRSAVSFPADMDQLSLRIGMIDSDVDVSHPSLKAARIQSRSFTADGAELPSFHGTAIASIIAASGSEFVGIAPNAELYAAAVFEQDPQRGEIASTVSLVRALDWLISSGVDVVNISLAGPPNRLLEAALQRASEQGVMILAAAGNGGPVAEPMYPAAYTSVVAVTAVDSNGQVFRLANRGEYLDISAPGVGMRHARSGGGYAASSGTSFAVPFATTAVARLRQLQPGDNALELLYQSAEDLGPPGRDTIYGYGLLRPAKS